MDVTVTSQLVEVAVHSTSILDAVTDRIAKERANGNSVLRWGIVARRDGAILLELVVIDGVEPKDGDVRVEPSRDRGAHAVALIVPTGVGASMGGFIGDAGPVARLLESVADVLILHPNVSNGADLYGAGDNALYVDGHTLDEFFAGRAYLGRPTSKRIGLIIDRLEPGQEALILNAANACSAVWGIETVGYAVCAERVRSTVHRTELGHFFGQLHNATALFDAAERLISAGAETLGVVTAIEGISDDTWKAHYYLEAPNPVGAMEAVISRVLTWKTGLPCAHAPAYIDGMATADEAVDPRAAAEVVSKTGLPCILRGLSRASAPTKERGLAVSDLAAIIVPFECAGGAPALAARTFGIPLIAVKSNRCAVGLRADELDVPSMIAVENYAEAAAYVAATRAGIRWQAIIDSPQRLKKL